MNSNIIFSLMFAIVLLTGCQARVETSPVPQSTQQTPIFAARQFDPTGPFISGVDYPQELLALADEDLIPLACTHDYFSWSGNDHEFVDPSTQEHFPIQDSRLLGALDSAHLLNPDQTITSISLCAVTNSEPLVFFRVGPCGGGCAGILNIAIAKQDGTLQVVATIQPGGDGAYFACSPLALSKSSILFMSCLGEGTAIIRRVDMSDGEVSVILRCQDSTSTSSCGTE